MMEVKKRRLFTVLLFVFLSCEINADSESQSAKNYFKDGHFLDKSVVVPRVYRGSGRVDKISGPLSNGNDVTNKDDGELKDLLQRIFKKVVTLNNRRNHGGKTRPAYDKGGVAHRVQERIPDKYSNKRSEQHQNENRVVKENHVTNEIKNGGGVTLKDITSSVDKLINELTKREGKYFAFPNENNTKKRADLKFKFTEVDEDHNVDKSRDLETKKSALKDGYEKFEDKFYDIFVNSKKDAVATDKPYLFPVGKDWRHKNTQQRNVAKENRLNSLYDELKQKTREESRNIKRLEQRKRIEYLKRDILGLLNKVQDEETFTYDGKRFGLERRENNRRDPKLIVSKDASDDEAVKKSEDSRLDTVNELINQLYELKAKKKKKREKYHHESQNHNELDYDSLYKKKVESSVTKKDTKVQNDQVKGTDKLSGMLEDLVGELKKRVKSSHRKTATSKRDSSTTTTEKRMENDLENIATKLNDKHGLMDERTRKALSGFNVKKDELRKHYDRP